MPHILITCHDCKHIQLDKTTLPFYMNLASWARSQCPKCGSGMWILEVKELDNDRREYTDEQTGVQLIIERDNPEYPDYPKLMVVCPTDRTLPFEDIDAAMKRLQERAGIAVEQRMAPLYWCES